MPDHDSSSNVLNESFSIFEDDEDDNILAQEANAEENRHHLPQSRQPLFRHLTALIILVVGAIFSTIAYLVARNEDERLCTEVAEESIKTVQADVEKGLRTEVDVTKIDPSSFDCRSSWPATLCASVALFFFAAAVGFVLYDRHTQKQLEQARKLAERSTQLVASLYPKQVRDRLFAQKHASDQDSQTNERRKSANTKSISSKELTPGVDANDIDSTPPIADMFPATTVMFADVAGFTAWSSAREPVQVFQLLETLYNALIQPPESKRRG
jgi:hypothetical protein